MFLRNVLGSLLAIVFAAVPSFGQARPNLPAPTRAVYSINGNVREDASQQIIENVRVDLKGFSGGAINTAYTRSNGEFEFDNLSNGEYYVEVVLEGYEPYRDSVVIQGQSRRGVDVLLRKPIVLDTVKATGTISLHQLSVPSKAHDEFDKGIALLYGKADYPGAMKQLQRAIKDFPGYYEAYAEEGSTYVFMGDAAMGEAAFRKSIELSQGRYTQAIFLLAGLLNNANRYMEAETFARQGLAVEASSWRGYIELARALVGQKRPEDAEKSAIQSRDLKPDNPQIYLVLANVHIQERDGAALLQDLEEYLKFMPNGPDADQARKTRDMLLASQQKAEAAQDPQP